MESSLTTPTPAEISKLKGPTDKFLCKLSDNWPKFKFLGFKIRDMISNLTLVEVEEDGEVVKEEDDEPSKRMIKYHLGPDFLMLRTVGLTMRFGIGEQPIQNLEMIERHYFRGKVIRDFGFRFGFVIPGSENEWEMVYDLPELTEEEVEAMTSSPWEVKSDSFFFANGRLIIHNRAEYNYSDLD